MAKSKVKDTETERKREVEEENGAQPNTYRKLKRIKCDTSIEPETLKDTVTTTQKQRKTGDGGMETKRNKTRIKKKKKRQPETNIGKAE